MLDIEITRETEITGKTEITKIMLDIEMTGETEISLIILEDRDNPDYVRRQRYL